MKQKKYLFILSTLTILFCFTIGFDLNPYLRGPAPYPPEWRWEYFFVNTLSKIYLPITCILSLIGFFLFCETKNKFEKKTKFTLFILILFSFIFQLSILHFSRSGIPVLIQRIINPEINSYFTASLSIQNPLEFLRNYEQEMKNFIYHARSHPPGAILIFYGIKQVISPFTFFINFVSQLNPSHNDVKQIWNSLLPIDKATAVFSAFFLPLLSSLIIIPIFKTAERLYGKIIAVRSSFAFIFIPSIILFIPIHDAFLPLFSITAFYFLLKSLQDKSSLSFFLSGLILFLGVTFNLSFLPLLLLFFLFTILFLKKNNLLIKNFLIKGLLFVLGFFLPPILLYIFFNFNFIHLIQIILEEVVHIHTRSYTTWLFYNILDFFIFVGVPLTIVFLTQIKNMFNINQISFVKNIDILFLSFLVMFIILDLSGSTRGETGRIWAIFIPFLLLPAVAHITNKIKFSTKFFAGFLALQALQILVMQEFWVMLW